MPIFWSDLYFVKLNEKKIDSELFFGIKFILIEMGWI